MVIKGVTFHAKIGAKTAGNNQRSAPKTAYRTASRYVSQRERLESMEYLQEDEDELKQNCIVASKAEMQPVWMFPSGDPC